MPTPARRDAPAGTVEHINFYRGDTVTTTPGTTGTTTNLTTGPTTDPTTDPTTGHRRRPAAVVASVLVALIAAVGGYGAIYFTGLEGWDGIGVSFVVAYEFLSLIGLLAAIAHLRGHRLGRPAVVLYATWIIYFTLYKLIAFQELQAIPFGVLAAIALACVIRPPAR